MDNFTKRANLRLFASLIGVLLLAFGCAQADFVAPTTQPTSDELTVDPNGNQESTDATNGGNGEEEGGEEGGETIEPTPEPSPGFQFVDYELEEEFVVSRAMDANFATNPEYGTIDQQVTMAVAAPVTTRLTQAERPFNEVAATQGRDGNFVSEEHAISSAGLLDILIVMDDSTSMYEEQTNLSTNLNSLLTHIGNTDWQIGVVTTADPCLRGGATIKDDGVSDIAQQFKDAIEVPLDGTVVEKGFPMAIQALQGNCPSVTNADWIREDSAIAVLIVSDEDNCGSHSSDNCTGEQGETPQQMVDYLNSIRPAGKAKIYGLIEGVDGTCSNAFYAPEYLQGITDTGGTWGSICGDDAEYSSTLERISLDVSRIVTRDFNLQFAPDAGRYNVFVDNTEITTGFTVSGSMISLDNATGDQVTLRVDYYYDSVPQFERLMLNLDADPSSISVTYDGVPADPNHYMFDDTTGELFFNTLPPDNVAVMAKYRIDTPLPDAFSLASSQPRDQPIEVRVDGSPVSTYIYDEQTKKIVFDQAPADGLMIEVVHQTSGDQTTAYDLADGGAAMAKDVYAVETGTTVPVEVDLQGNKIVFAEGEVVDGRMVTVVFDIGYEQADMTFELGQDPVADSVVITADRDDDCLRDYDLQGRTLELTCDQPVGSILVAYVYQSPVETEFVVAGDFQEDEPIQWEVFIDGQPTTAFSVTDESLIAVSPNELDYDSAVVIKAKQKQRLEAVE